MASKNNKVLFESYKAAAGAILPTAEHAARKSSAIPFPITIADVQLKVTAFQFKMQELVTTLQTAAPHLQILKADKFYSQMYIDKASLGRLNTIAMNTNFEQFGVFFGLEDPDTQDPLTDMEAPGFGRLTCCFVGLDKDLQVLEDHFPPSLDRPYSVEAEDTWPPPPPPPGSPKLIFDLSRDPNDVFAYFNVRQTQPIASAISRKSNHDSTSKPPLPIRKSA